MTVCRICDREPARFRMLYDTPNGRADNPLCLRCVAGRLAAYPPNRLSVPKDFTPTEIIPMANNDITEEEMEELIASKDWPPYYMTMGACGGYTKGGHKACPAMRQPTNHIDPHPTICTCECHDEDSPELKAIRERQQGFKEDPEDDDFIFDDDEEEDDEEWEFDDDDDPIIEDDDEDELILDDDEDEYVFD